MKWLSDYTLDEATRMMHDPCWTRAVFIRDPAERILSSYKDKAVYEPHLFMGICKSRKPESFLDFLQIVQVNEHGLCLSDRHFTPQYRLIDEKWWPRINFIGDFNRRESESRRLLKQIGAWEEFGASGWGPNRTDPFFHSSSKCGKFCGNTAKSIGKYYTETTELLVRRLHIEDYIRFYPEKLKSLLNNCHQS
mmetsp:Transcript_16618/g.24979  ORF Transcript_16618/g.24979 Transcript_16618/m.24979 type:complete len:193 (-) Transcript_16618:78-656(-)